MAFIETVLGKVDPASIGKTDAHDHLIRKGGVEVITNGSDFDMPADSGQDAHSQCPSRLRE